jgi:hypothetical protein
LSQDKGLVNREYKNILLYLITLYPGSSQKLYRKTPSEIIDIYDKLDLIFTFVGDNVRVNILPDGYFYFWKTYLNKNMYTVHSSGTLLDNEPFRADGGSNNQLMVMGPAPDDFPIHTYSRNIYYPFGPIYDDAFTRWTYLNGIDVRNKEENMGFLWKYNKWAFGLKEGDKVEVAVRLNSAISPGIWLVPFYGGGTGVTYTIGRTKWAVNKVDMLLKLLQEFKEQNEDILFSMYNTSDPYIITWRYCCSMGYTNTWGALARDVDNNPVIFPGKYIEIPNTGILTETGLMTKNNIGESVRGSNSNEPVYFNDLALWYSHEYGMYDHEHSDDESTYGMIKFSIDAVCTAEDWILDRVCLVESLDEPIFWLGVTLGYQTLQFTVNASHNGTWQPLIIDLSLPKRWKRLAKNRRYVFIKQINDVPIYTSEAGVVFERITDRLLERATI